MRTFLIISRSISHNINEHDSVCPEGRHVLLMWNDLMTYNILRIHKTS